MSYDTIDRTYGATSSTTTDFVFPNDDICGPLERAFGDDVMGLKAAERLILVTGV